MSKVKVSIIVIIVLILGIALWCFKHYSMQTNKKVEYYSGEINNFDSLNRFKEFLNKNKGKNIHLNISLCPNNLAGCPEFETTNNSLLVKYSSNNTDEKKCSLENKTVKDIIYFNEQDDGEIYWKWDENANCEDGITKGVLSISNHFLAPSTITINSDINEWQLAPVSPDAISLNY